MKAFFHKYFWPHPGNDHKPHLLRSESAAAILMVILVLQVMLCAHAVFVVNKSSFMAAVLPGVLTALTNTERGRNNAAPLSVNPLLEKAAALKASDMATRGYFSHNSPEGLEPWHWLQQVGYSYETAGENLAVDFFDSADVAQAWMNSPTHRSNIVNQNYSEIGIALAEGIYQGRTTVFVVQFFGTPRIARAETVILDIEPVVSEPKKTPAIVPRKKVTTATPSSLFAFTSASSSISTTSFASIGDESTPGPQVLAAISKSSPTQNVKFSSKFFEQIAVSPRLVNKYLLGTLLAVVLMAMILLAIKFGEHHKQLIFNGVGIVVLILSFMLLNQFYGLKVKLPSTDQSASVSQSFR